MTSADISVLFYILLLLVSAYALYLLTLWLVLLQKDKNSKAANKAPEALAIVLPFKNESEHLKELISHYRDFTQQVIFVNDHSADLTVKAIDALFDGSPHLLLHLPKGLHGKKTAIHYAIGQCTAAWILTTDADTRINKYRLESALKDLPAEKSAFVFPVEPLATRALGGPFFDLEFIALQAVGCASAKMERPLLANGAAFMYRRSAYLGALAERIDWDLPGGDDVFTLHAIASSNGRKATGCRTDQGPLAYTTFPETFAGLWKQRLRWIGKTHRVKSYWFSAISILALTANMATITAYCFMYLTGDWSIWFSIPLVKIAGELLLLAWGVLYFRRLDCLWWIIPGTVIYPIYFFALMATSLAYTPRWK